MMNEARNIAHRLALLSEASARSADLAPDVDEARYRASSAALVTREAAKLTDALSGEDRIGVAWALRSIADMMKGLIETGADFPHSAPGLWQEASDLTDRAHAVERASR